MKSSTIWIVNLNKAIKFIKYIILHFSGFFKKNTLTSQLSIVTCKLVKILDRGSQPVELLLTCLGHFCTMVSPFFWVMDSYIFGFGTQWEEGMGWEVGKPRINTDFPLPTLQNSEKNVINFWEVPLNMGVPLESRCCHKVKGIWNVDLCLQFSSQYFVAFIYSQLFYLSTWANPGFYSNIKSKENCQWKGFLEDSFPFFCGVVFLGFFLC